MKIVCFMFAATCSMMLAGSCSTKAPESFSDQLTTPGNPFLPLWEHIPDGEPYVFEDPDHPGKYRVYVYGSHDNMVTGYCGRDQVVWSAPVDSLTQWRYDGVISVSKRMQKVSCSMLRARAMCSMHQM